MTEQPAPYGAPSTPASSSPRRRRVRIPHLQEMKQRGERWSMLTAYARFSAEVFDEAGIPALLIGDSASNTVLGNDATQPITVEEMLPMARAVSRAARHALVISDLPFGSYEVSPEQAFATAVRFVKEAGVHAVKMEGGEPMLPQIEMLTSRGIPVISHLGFTPQSEHTLGGYRVQGRADGGEALLASALAAQEAGAFAVLLEMIPAELGARISGELRIPTVGIGAGAGCDAQVLVWQDMAGLNSGRLPRFVKQFADLRGALAGAARAFDEELRGGSFPGPEHSF
ncbi:3-methyl-2-oxobutanoate hydroxymethyltransferase [Brachybacterium horti]